MFDVLLAGAISFFSFFLQKQYSKSIGLKGMTEMEIDRTIKEWKAKTCVKFVPRTNETDYIKFLRGEWYVKAREMLGKVHEKQRDKRDG